MSVPSARRQWVKSDCQVSFGCAASNRTYEDFGRLRGSGVISPAVCRMRRIVDVEGEVSPSCRRCQAIVTGPASVPAAVSARRSWTTRSRTRPVTACGLLNGARDRASNPSKPSSRYRARSLCRYCRDTPYSAAAAVTDSSPATTFNTTTRCFDDMPECRL